MAGNNNDEPIDVEQVGWNMSGALLQEISGLLVVASNATVNRDLPKTFDCLKAIKMRIISNLSDSERSELDKLESEIVKRVMLEEGKEDIPEKLVAPNRFRLAQLTDKYNLLLMQLLERYGYMISKKEDAKRVW